MRPEPDARHEQTAADTTERRRELL